MVPKSKVCKMQYHSNLVVFMGKPRTHTMMDIQGYHPMYLSVTYLHMKNAALPFASHQNMFIENIYKIIVFRVLNHLQSLANFHTISSKK